MNKLTTKLLGLSTVLLLLLGLTVGTASAQDVFAEKDGTGADPCAVTDPCDLDTAVIVALGNAVQPNTVFVRLPTSSTTTTFELDLDGTAAISDDVAFGTYRSSGGVITEGGPAATTPLSGIVDVEGDIVVESDVTLTIADALILRLSGQEAILEMNDRSTIDGDGFLEFSATGGNHVILLGFQQPFDCLVSTPPNRADIRNMTVNKPNGDVQVKDECSNQSDLFITNRLNISGGSLEMNNNNLHLSGRTDFSDVGGAKAMAVADCAEPDTGDVCDLPRGDDAGVSIAGGATIEGSGSFFIRVEEPNDGPDDSSDEVGDPGSTDDDFGFANTADDCFVIDGAGNLNMAIDKVTNAGVCIDLDEIGAGGKSHNRAGTLYVREALQFNGIFINESLTGDVPSSGARTEFWNLATITTGLEVEGPGEETIDPFGDFINYPTSGHCEGSFGNESGVFFFTAVTVKGELILTDTDDTDTTPCVEGVWFMGEDDPGNALAKGAGPSDHQPFSTVEGTFTSHGGPNGLYLDSGDFVHNVAFQGDFGFDDPSPTFTLVAPADASPVGDLCSAYSNEADGNKVLFTGSADQTLRYTDADDGVDGSSLYISSVQIKKTNTGDRVVIDDDGSPPSGEFLIDVSLEVLRGSFRTNGQLDAGTSGDVADRATVVINRDDDGTGVLQAGDSDRAYISDDDEDVPKKVKYTGSIRHFSGDEIPGDRDGSVEGAEIRLPFLEIFTSVDDAVITLGKDFTIGDSDATGDGDAKLIITRGILDVGSAVIRLANQLRIEIGDGTISEPNQIGSRGDFDFPTEWIPTQTAVSSGTFDVGEDGIDLLYFGTSLGGPRTVGLEWPPASTTVDRRYVDADVIRDVTVNPACEDDHIEIDLRGDDDEFRINGDVIIGGFPFLDSAARADIGGQPAFPGCTDTGCNANEGSGSGELDINGDVLEINATHAFDDGINNTVVEVHKGSKLTDSTDPLLASMARTAELVVDVRGAIAEYRRTQTAKAGVEMQVQIDLLKAAQAEQEISKTATHAGLLRFIGADRTDVWVGTTEAALRFDLPAIEVDKEDLGSDDDNNNANDERVTFNANGILSTTTGGVDANNPDVIGTSHFTLTDARTGSDDCRTDRMDSGCGDGGGVELLTELDVFDIGGYYYQFDGEFLMNGLSSIGPVPIKPYVQTVIVGFRFTPGDMVIEDGEFYAGDNDDELGTLVIGGFGGAGGNVEVFGDFCLGCTPPATSGAASKMAADPHSGVFSLAQHGTQTVVGDFTVGPDTDPSDAPLDTDARNRYYLGGECAVLPDRGGLFANGNYHFEGTGDRFDDLDYLTQEQGLEGNVFFTGATEQFVWHRQDEDAYFCDVIMASRSTDNDGIELLGNTWQNDHGTLTLEHGIIDVGADSSNWIILNVGFEVDLAGSNNSCTPDATKPASLLPGICGGGVVDLGSRDSYINGEVDRRVEFGNASGGIITGGYIFPVGQQGEERQDGAVGGRDVDFFRPLILQFPNDLGRHSLAQVNYVGARGEPGDSTAYAKTATEIRPEDCEWPEGGLVVDAVRSPRGPGGTLTLDVLSNQFWQLEFDRIPSFDPNIRVEADELPNIFEITALRLIQWDCDCTNPRLAGLYDLTGVRDPVDDGSAVLNDFINSVPNLTQEGVNVNDCNIIGIASNFLINQINIPENPRGFAKVQIIHNSPDAGEIDVYIDGNRVWNDAPFQSATPFTPVIGGTHTIEIVAGGDADNSNPFFSQTLTVFNDINYVVVAHGLVGDTGERAFKLVVENDVRLRSTDDQNVDFFILHGATGLGEIDIRELDPVNNNDVIRLLTNNFGFDDVVRALSLDAGEGHNIEITTANNDRQIDVFRFELQAQRELSVVLTLSGSLGKASFDNTTDLTIMGVQPDGRTFFPDLITANDPDPIAELPTTFELFGNYPNPFNPSTTISFDLPQTAEVTIEIIDMLGRSVMLLPAKQMEAGAKRTVEVNASNLASGAYLYRLIAKTATETMVKTGRMMLIK